MVTRTLKQAQPKIVGVTDFYPWERKIVVVEKLMKLGKLG